MKSKMGVIKSKMVTIRSKMGRKLEGLLGVAKAPNLVT